MNSPLSLSRELVGIAEGRPEYTEGRQPTQIRLRALTIVSSLCAEAGLKVSQRIGRSEELFDLEADYRGYPVYFDLKFGRVTSRDVNRAITTARGALLPTARVVLIGSEITTDARLVLTSGRSPNLILLHTFESFAEMFSAPGGAALGVFRQQLDPGTRTTISTDPSDEQIVQYMIRVFGRDFWQTLSKSELSLDILRSIKGILGRSDVTLVFVGTTHTGKSSIANALFGDDVVSTGEITDITGAIARIHLPNGLTIVDTPGVGGINERYEEVTRTFLGLPSKFPSSRPTSVPAVEITSKRKSQSVTSAPLDARASSVVVILVFDLGGGFKRSDLEFLGEIRSKFPNVVVAGNKRDTLSNDSSVEVVREDLKRRAFTDFVAVAAKPANRDGRPISIDTLVNAICAQLSESAVTTFNDVLVKHFRLGRERLVHDAILRVAARASTVTPQQVLPEVGVPIHKVLLTGLIMRLGIDYGVGGARVRNELETSIRQTFGSIAAMSSRRETNVETKSRQVRKLMTRAPGGAAAGAAAGAAIGALGGPAGMFLGAILGALFGGAIGASVPLARMVQELWNTPEDAIQEVPGGSEASIATIAFGLAVLEAFSRIEEGKATGIEPARFASTLARTVEDARAKIPPAVRRQLDSGIDEVAAYRQLSSLPLF